MTDALATIAGNDTPAVAQSHPMLAALVAAFQHAAIGMAVRLPDGQLLDVNPAFARMLGYERGALLAMRLAAVTHPEDRMADGTEWRRLRIGQSHAYQREQRYLRQDGSIVWGLSTVSALRDERGQFIGGLLQLQDLTAQKATEAALREREAELRVLVDRLPAALYRLEPGERGRYTYVSPQLAALTGLEPDHPGRGLAAFIDRIHPDDIAAFEDAGRRADDTGDRLEIAYRVRGADGEWRWVHNRAILARDGQGQPLAWRGVLVDVSEQRALEASLHESEERFQLAFQGAGIGMSLADPRGPILDANPALCQFLGYTHAELRQMTYFEVIHPDDREVSAAMARAILEREIGGYACERRYIRKDGEVAWGYVNVHALIDGEARLRYVIAQIQDITSRKEAEGAVRESEARFRALVQNDPDVIAIIDDTMTLTYISPSVTAAFGVPPETLLGPIDRNLHYVHPDDLERWLALFDRVGAEPGATATVETRIKHIDRGWRWFQTTIANRLDEPGIDGYLLNLRDISDLKLAELATKDALATQQRAIAELEWLNRSKSQFLSTISHEFRTPLTAISGYSELLAANAGDPATIAEDAAVIHREASRLNRMVDDVLLVDRLDADRLPLHIASVDLNTLVQDVVQTFRPLSGKHEIVVDLDPSVRCVDGDRDRLAQVLTNLIGNALKYSPDGGVVAIVTRGEGDGAHIAVRDEGIGIAAEHQARIFGRFERVETGIAGRIAGTGLGLPIAQEIVSRHGGRLWVESTLGAGSTFHLVIPACRAESKVESRKSRD